MMEFREHPRTVASEPRVEGMAEDPGSRFRLRRFEFRQNERQIDVPRVLLAALLALAALSTMGYLSLRLVRGAVEWLHQQPQYQLSFQEIQLRPEPPAWLRGGSGEFLRQVREQASEPESLSVLKLDSTRLRRAFSDHSPWVEDVIRIDYPPQAIIVELAYKRPVAWLEENPSSGLLLDRNGHLLPVAGIEMEKLGPLIKIWGHQLTPATDNRPGGIWKSGLSGTEAARSERNLRGAAALAGFLQESLERDELTANPALRVQSIFATDHRGHFVATAEGVQILWGEPPGKESPGSLDAPRKWEIMKKWATSPTHRELARGGFWTFTRSELKAVEPGGKA